MGTISKKKFFNLIIVIIIVGIVMFLAINSSSCSLFKKKNSTAVTNADGSAVTNADGSKVTATETAETPETKKEEKEEKKPFGPTFDLGEIIVNLSDAGQARYAKMSVAIELEDEKTLIEAEEMDPLIRDIVVELLSGETSEKILSLTARNDLKKRILDRVNEHFEEGKVMHVFFTNVLVQ